MNDNPFVRSDRPSKHPGADDDGAGRGSPWRGRRLMTQERVTMATTIVVGLACLVALLAIVVAAWRVSH